MVGLYGTGADICYIEELAFDKFPTRLKPKLLNTKQGVFKADNGGLLQAHGQYLTPFRWGIKDRPITLS